MVVREESNTLTMISFREGERGLIYGTSLSFLSINIVRLGTITTRDGGYYHPLC